MEFCNPNELSNPFDAFKNWYEVFQKNSKTSEPTSMTLSTTDNLGQPSARVVLLKDWDQDGFVFYTNYDSPKCQDMDANPKVSLLFYWEEFRKQVRIQGDASRVSTQESEEYFSTRPRGSQLGAWASKQSQKISGRDELIDRIKEYESKYPNEVPRPENWGGYRIKPNYFEFWVCGEHRLHDRYCFTFTNGEWSKKQISP